VKSKISAMKNGPLKLTSDKQIVSKDGTILTIGNPAMLCTCGKSATKPICDGAHVAAQFSSERVIDNEILQEYPGKEITIYFNRSICAGAGTCVRGLPTVFKSGDGSNWIFPDEDTVENVIGRVVACPSGALAYSLGDDVIIDGRTEEKITIEKDGPYNVEGVTLENKPNPNYCSDSKYALCRCGFSKNKPYCDYSHGDNGWHEEDVLLEGAAADGKSAGADKARNLHREWRKVPDADALKDGQTLTLKMGANTIVVSNDDGKFGALDNACPHQGGPLGESSVKDGCLQCPWHGWSFDARTGECDKGDVASYPVEIRDDGVYVEIEVEDDIKPTVSMVMAETMVNWGVTHVFGIVGHSNLGLADAIRKLEVDGKLKFIGVRHEGAAAFAASGFAKASGKPAACLTIAGPGATNLLTGLWDAKVDSAPVLALTGQVQTQVLGPGAFQELDLAAAFDAVTHWSQTVLQTSHHAELMNLAMKNAIVNRKVTHLIFPDEVQVQEVEEDSPAGKPEGRMATTVITPSAESITQAVDLIGNAKRPAIIVGYGALGHMDAVEKLAKQLKCPILTTFKGKGLISDHHPLAAGVLGRSGTPIAASCMSDADLLIVLGASFAAHTGIDADKPTIQVDFDQMALAKFHPVTVPVWGEIGTTCRILQAELPTKISTEDQRPHIGELWAEWRAEKNRRAEKDNGKGMNSAVLFNHLSGAVPENAVIAVDVGNNTYSFGRYFECRNQSVLMSGYLGSIGFGFTAAMGAWAACPDRPIVAVAGDGGFGQYLGEVTTAVKYGMNITLILLNNSELGKISTEQRNGNWDVWETSLHNPNFSDFARNCGAHGVRVTDFGELDSALSEALAYDGPAIVEVMTDPGLV